MAIKSTGLVTKGLRSDFFQRFDGVPTQYQNLSTRLPSDSDRETYRFLGTVPQVREWGNGRVARGLRTESYSVENLKYEATIEVDRDEVSDDQTGQIRIRVQELADRAATHKDYLIAQLLINGDQAGYNSYDGVTFFNDTHASGASGNQDNNLTFDASDHTKVTAVEFLDAFKAAMAAMMGFKDAQGEPMNCSASGLVVIAPPLLYPTALTALSAAMLNNSSNPFTGSAQVVMLPWLTSGVDWYLLKTDRPIRPFIFQDREPVEFTALDKDDGDEAFRREKYLYGVRARYRMTYGYWQYAVKTKFN